MMSWSKLSQSIIANNRGKWEREIAVASSIFVIVFNQEFLFLI
jgi:hypothetical protein